MATASTGHQAPSRSRNRSVGSCTGTPGWRMHRLQGGFRPGRGRRGGRGRRVGTLCSSSVTPAEQLGHRADADQAAVPVAVKSTTGWCSRPGGNAAAGDASTSSTWTKKHSSAPVSSRSIVVATSIGITAPSAPIARAQIRKPRSMPDRASLEGGQHRSAVVGMGDVLHRQRSASSASVRPSRRHMAALARRNNRSGVRSAISVTASRNATSRIDPLANGVSERSISGRETWSGSGTLIGVNRRGSEQIISAHLLVAQGNILLFFLSHGSDPYAPRDRTVRAGIHDIRRRCLRETRNQSFSNPRSGRRVAQRFMTHPLPQQRRNAPLVRRARRPGRPRCG